MYEIVNEPNLTITFDMDTELSQLVYLAYILNRATIFVLGTLTLVTGLVFIGDTKN